MLVAFITWNEGCGREPRVKSGAILRMAAAFAIATLVAPPDGVQAQSGNPADVAAKLSGRWKLNEELTPASAGPAGRGRGGPSFATAGAPLQRGGRGGGGGGGHGVVFREPRGEWRFQIDGKNSAMQVPGGWLHSKSRWDHGTLHQEFSSAQKKLVKSWSIDANDRLVLTERFDCITSNSESKAMFDRHEEE